MSTQAEHALQNFFRKANLIALRELALRQMAERVNVEMQTARLGGGARQTWATAERLLVCVGPSPMSPRVIRTAKRMASLMRADWIAAYVELPGAPELESKARQRLAQNMKLAEQLGAEVVTLSGASAADELLSYARTRNVTRIVVGKPGHVPWYRRLRRSLVDDLLRSSREIDVHVIHGVEEPLARGPVPERSHVPWHDYARTLLLVACCGVADYFIKFRLGLAEANVVMVLLLGVMYSAAKYGRGPGVLASVTSVLLFDFFFVPPYKTFAVSDAQYLLTFAVMFGVAVVTSALAARIREQAEHSRGRARRTEALYNMSRQLSGQVGRLQLADVATRQLAAIFGGEAAIMLPHDHKRLKVASSTQAGFATKENELAVAEWVFTHQQQAGLGTNTLPSAHGVLHSARRVARRHWRVGNRTGRPRSIRNARPAPTAGDLRQPNRRRDRSRSIGRPSANGARASRDRAVTQLAAEFRVARSTHAAGCDYRRQQQLVAIGRVVGP